MDEKPFGRILDIADAQPGQLRSPHPAGKTDEQDHPVPELDKALSELCHRSSDLCGGDRSLLVTWGNPEAWRSPRIVSLTSGSLQGLPSRARLCAWLIAERRRVSVETAAGSRSSGGKPSSERYPATRAGDAGRPDSPSISHQVEKSEKSER